MDENEIADRFRSRELTEGARAAVVDLGEMIGLCATAIGEMCAPSRETSLALTAIEEAAMWANKSISRNGVRA